jgi:gliding motility-associated-like protein
VLTIFLFITTAVHAQLKADFTIDRATGCAPLQVSFTNTSSGFSPNVIFTWDFGNGNASTLKDPGAIFTDERSYTVKLTVTDGSQTVSVTKTVIVYKRPEADFTVSEVKGCAPFKVSFSTSAKPGDGTIASYYWDFGDGVTSENYTPAIDHNYTSDQIASVSLTVRNSYGCYVNVEKKDLLNILKPLVPAFKQSTDFLCRVSDNVTLLNQSTGPGTLSYLWEFGDGVTSTEKDPVHAFNVSGAYKVKLNLTSSEGCKTSVTSANTLNVANFKSALEEPASYCLQTTHLIKNISSPVPSSYKWLVNGTESYQFEPGPLQFYAPTTGTYKVTLINRFGTCMDTVEKEVVVNKGLDLEGFLISLKDRCARPQEYVFTDTTKGAVEWLWHFYEMGRYANTKQTTQQLFANGNYSAELNVRDAKGCWVRTVKRFDARKADGEIEFLNSDGRWGFSLCGKGNVQMRLKTLDTIVSYAWTSGNGLTSTAAEPKFYYDKPGDYFPEVSVVTTDGCKYTLKVQYPVMMRDSIKAAFTTNSLSICGNTPTIFTDVSTIPSTSGQITWGWDLDDKGSFYSFPKDQNKNYTLQFQDSGRRRVRYMVSDLICWDTAVAYINVLPPLPDIKGFTNTCEGTRGLVTFNFDAKYAVTGSWDFGDGGTSALTVGQSQIQHEFKKTGFYKTILTTTNGQCTVKDSVMVNVLLKQNPILAAENTDICTEGGIAVFKISNLDSTPVFNDYWYYGGYSTYDIVDRNGKYIGAKGDIPETIDKRQYTWRRYSFSEPIDQIRVVVRSQVFGCADTTNAVSVKIKGPIAAMKVIPTICPENNTVFFGDSSSTSFGNKIVKWEWSSYIEPPVVRTDNSEFPYVFRQGGYRGISLKVTDAAGCTNTQYSNVDVSNTSLKAAFNVNTYQVSPGTTLQFNNTSLTSDPVNTVYQWWFGDGSGSTDKDPSKLFSTPGTYTVQLILRNTNKGCTDTATASILVKNVNAAFTINNAYLTQANCPPLRVQFNNTSSNVVRIAWDFGDGGTSVLYSPSHLYTKAGTYVVRVKTYSDNGTEYTNTDTVRIAVPTGSISADSLFGCTNKLVNFKASVANANTYWWDFGDGNVISTRDSTTNHNFNRAGSFKPRLIIKDMNGCAVSADLPDNVRIDSLSLQILDLPAQICAPRTLQLRASAQTAILGQTLSYQWRAGTDTSSLQNASLSFANAGTYPVSLTVNSQYGCQKTVTRNLVAFQGLGAVLNGPDMVCQGTVARFNGSTAIPGSPTWQWTFPNGSSSTLADPAPIAFNQTGSYQVKLVVSNSGCNDTIIKNVVVNPNPVNILSQRSLTLCAGSAVELRAQGAASYKWTPASGLLSDTGSVVMAAPSADLMYRVSAISANGCVGKDSVMIRIVKKKEVQLPAELSLCSGSSIQIKATGADAYQWIGNTAGLSSTSIADPTAKPIAAVRYTVVGSDAQRCFSDTAIVNMIILPSPTVDAGPGGEVSVGASFALQSTVSADVKTYNWSPDKYLTCSNCPSPIVTPTENVTYTLRVVNDKGCIAADTVTVNVLCNESKIYIPNAFTPNGDGKNDLFMLAGQGIKVVRSLKIFDRFGTMIFEKTNFQVNDPGSAWNGRIGGKLVPAGSYIYVAELSCDEKNFMRKGSITVIY